MSDQIWNKNFTFACIASFSFFIGCFFYFSVLPPYVLGLGGNETVLGIVIAMANFIAMLTRPFMGFMTDQYGRKRLMYVGAVLFIISSMLFNLASSIGIVILIRIFTGIALGFFVTAINAYVADIVPSKRRGEAIGYFGIFHNVAVAIGPAVGWWIISSSWTLGTENHLRTLLPTPGPDKAGIYNYSTLFLLASILGLLSLIASFRMKEKPVSLKKIESSHVLKSFSFSQLFYRPALFPGFINSGLWFIHNGLISFMPLYSMQIGLENIGLFFTFYALGMVCSRIIGGKISDRLSRSAVVVPGLFLILVSMAIMAWTHSIIILLLTGIVCGFGFGIVHPALTAMVVDRAEEDKRGSALSTFMIGQDAGLTLGAILLGIVLTYTSFKGLFFCMGGLITVLLLFFIINERYSKKQNNVS